MEKKEFLLALMLWIAFVDFFMIFLAYQLYKMSKHNQKNFIFVCEQIKNLYGHQESSLNEMKTMHESNVSTRELVEDLRKTTGFGKGFRR